MKKTGKMVRRKEGLIFLLVSKELTAFPNRTSLEDINKNCFEQFRRHWNCLENKNQQLWQCRKAERVLNACVFEKLVRFLHMFAMPVLSQNRK